MWWPSRSRACRSMRRSWCITAGNVDVRRAIFSICYTRERKSFPRHSRQIGPDLGNRVPEQFLYLLPRDAPPPPLRHARQFPAHQLGLGQGLAGPPLLADVEVVEAFALAC